MKTDHTPLAVATLVALLGLSAPSGRAGESCCELPPPAAQAATSTSPGQDPASFSPERISVFAVPLQCAAAPEIGCGSLAKPLLLNLEGQAGVTGAWLNATGTLVAVVGDATSRRESLVSVVQAAAQKRQVSAKELKGAARDQALQDFTSGGGWHRGAEVDQLSKTEAGIIAARLVGRVHAKSTLVEATAEELRAAFAQYFERRFLLNPGSTAQLPANETREALLAIGREHLAATALPALEAAVAPGYRPLTGEK